MNSFTTPDFNALPLNEKLEYASDIKLVKARAMLSFKKMPAEASIETDVAIKSLGISLLELKTKSHWFFNENVLVYKETNLTKKSMKTWERPTSDKESLDILSALYSLRGKVLSPEQKYFIKIAGSEKPLVVEIFFSEKRQKKTPALTDSPTELFREQILTGIRATDDESSKGLKYLLQSQLKIWLDVQTGIVTQLDIALLGFSASSIELKSRSKG